MGTQANANPDSSRSAASPADGATGSIGGKILGALGPLLGLIAVFILFGLIDETTNPRGFGHGTFLSWVNLRSVTIGTCTLAIAALGMTLIIIAGGIDLSAGATLALAATVLAWCIREDVAALISHGTNFARASQRLDDAQRHFAQAQRAGDAARQQAEQTRIDAERTALQKLIDDKLALAEARSAADDPEAPTFARMAATLREKRTLLADTTKPVPIDAIWQQNIPNAPGTMPLAVLVGVLTGTLCGLLNGLLIAKLGVVPFIVTLGTMTLFVGVGNLLSDDIPIGPPRENIPPLLRGMVSTLPDNAWLGMPLGIWVTLLLAVATAVVLRMTVFGRYIVAIGSNETAATLCGIRVPRMKMAVYTCGGLLLGVAGVCFFAYTSRVITSDGLGMELRMIAAVVIGGASLAGGRGTVLGTLAGAAIIQFLDSGCRQVGFRDAVQRVIIGAVIIAAVALDQYRQRRLNRRL